MPELIPAMATRRTIVFVALMLIASRAAAAEEDFQPTPQTDRIDASARLCLYGAAKVQAEKSIQQERAYSAKYRVTDLRVLNNLKHHIQGLDAGMAASRAALQRSSVKPLACQSALLAEFIGCIEDDSDEDFRAMSEDDQYTNCHERGFGIPAAPAAPEQIQPQDLANLASRIPATEKELGEAQTKLARAGVPADSMNMALVCASDISVTSHLSIAQVVTQFENILARAGAGLGDQAAAASRRQVPGGTG